VFASATSHNEYFHVVHQPFHTCENPVTLANEIRTYKVALGLDLLRFLVEAFSRTLLLYKETSRMFFRKYF